MKATYGGHELPTWDEGSGPVWVYMESLGPVGVVRAETWEEAWECVVDEIMGDADVDDPDTWQSGRPDIPRELAEGCYWRGCGVPSNPHRTSPIAAEDLNGSFLIRLEALDDEWREKLTVTLDDDDDNNGGETQC